jgi:drug/metabolite transporter (DMT)-like permease
MQRQLPPQLAVLLSTLLWGTLWIPVRRMHELDSHGAWLTTLGFLGPLLVLLPMALGQRRIARAGLRQLAGAGFWLALGIALYTEGIVRGRIAPVILLFYLTPVWSTLLARIVLGEPIGGRRLLAIALGLAGLLVIFGAGEGLPGPRSAGEWMGLAAGVAWAIALVSFRREPERPLFDRVFVHFVFLGPVYFVVALIPEGAVAPACDIAWRPELLGWLAAFALVWMLPVVWLTVTGAGRVDPGRFAILLMFEIVVGLSTAALWTDEPLGPRELAGALLVLGACGSEITGGRRLRDPGSSSGRSGR